VVRTVIGRTKALMTVSVAGTHQSDELVGADVDTSCHGDNSG